MKKLLFLMALVASASLSHRVGAQSIEQQTELLTRTTAEPVIMIKSFEEFAHVLKTTSVDYIMISNSDTVNVFYYEGGELNVLRPGTCDMFWAVRDWNGLVVSYPYLFFDRASYSRKVFFRIGICKECRQSPVGVQFGFVKP